MKRERGKVWGTLALVAVLVGGFAAWAWSGSISAGQREERDDLELFLDASSAGWAEVTKQFFQVPEGAAQLVGALSGQVETPQDRLLLLAETIRGRSNLDAAYVGYPDGSFYFVARSDEYVPDGFRTRVISVQNGERTVELTWTDAALAPQRGLIDNDDEYDPRARPWYEPIAAGEDRYWTPPYVFASSQQPGITHSRAVFDEDGELSAVVGVDIRLTEVNEFLEKLSPGSNGVALVVDDKGQIIAESSMEVVDFSARSADGELALSQSSELLALVDRLGSADGAVRARSQDGLRTTIVRPAGARDEWYLAVRALDEDFLNDDTASDAFEVFAVGVTAAAGVVALGVVLLRYLVGLKQQAEIDELTRLYNRRAVKRELQSLLGRSKGPVHVAIIDLDDFKAINDEHGHPVGDRVLAVIAERLSEFASGTTSTVGRLGGDEFVVFGEGEQPDWAALNRELAVAIPLTGMEVRITASIGVACTSDAGGAEVDDLFGAADDLLFAAKRTGGDGFRDTAFSDSVGSH